MDSIDRLIDALDKCRDAGANAATRESAKSDLRAALVAVVLEDYKAGGSLRETLREDLLGAPSSIRER